MKKEFINALIQTGAFAGFQLLNAGLTGNEALHQYGEALQGTDSHLANFENPEAVKLFADYAGKVLMSTAMATTPPELYFALRDFKAAWGKEGSIAVEMEKKRAAFNLGYAILKAIVINGVFAPFIFGVNGGVTQLGAITAALPVILIFEILMRLASIEMHDTVRNTTQEGSLGYEHLTEVMEIERWIRNAFFIMEPVSLLTLTTIWNGGKPYFNDAWVGYLVLAMGFSFIAKQVVGISNAVDTFDARRQEAVADEEDLLLMDDEAPAPAAGQVAIQVVDQLDDQLPIAQAQQVIVQAVDQPAEIEVVAQAGSPSIASALGRSLSSVLGGGSSSSRPADEETPLLAGASSQNRLSRSGSR